MRQRSAAQPAVLALGLGLLVGIVAAALVSPQRAAAAGPIITLSGELKEAVDEGQVLTAPDYGLSVHATSGLGVASIEILVDGIRKDFASQTCVGCSMDRSWTFHRADYTNGPHVVRVLSKDITTTASSIDLNVTVGTATMLPHLGPNSTAAKTEVGPGSLNLVTGNFAVTEDDVSIDSFASDLTVTRTFNSRDPATSSIGPLGPGWLMSSPVDSANADYPGIHEDGADALLSLADGTQVRFQGGGGAYTAPDGYEDLTLTKPGGTQYRLEDLDANVTTFTKPSGSADYLPTSVNQPGSTTTTSFQYGSLNGADPTPRLLRVLAPVPQGVDCGSGLFATAPGCRYLIFNYANSTTASGSGESQWGDYLSRLKSISFCAYDPANGQMMCPSVARYSYDDTGRLRAHWDPRISPELKTTYDYDGTGPLTSVKPPGQNAWTIAYQSAQGDSNPGRLKSVSRQSPAGGTAKQTVVYGVPLSGNGAPYAMNPAAVGNWGQTDLPTDATAVFPPDAGTPSDPPVSYKKATVHYMNTKGDTVNVAERGGRISTTEYESHRKIRRELTARNRERALAAGSGSVARSQELDTRHIHSADGLELREDLGPLHEIELSNGTTTQARTHTVTQYDQGAPAGGPYHLPTTITVGAQIPGQGTDADQRVNQLGYGTTGWQMRKPISQTIDPAGLALTTTTDYDLATGLELEVRLPMANGAGTDAHTTKTVYYSGAANSADPECGGKPWFANLPCKTKPGGQPGGALPSLPITTFAYNRLNQVTTETDSVGSTQRVTTTTYDSAGRPIGSSISSPEGTALSGTTTSYEPATGLLDKTTGGGDTSGQVNRDYDAWGRVTSYSDGAGATSQTSYDDLNRLTQINDGKGSQTRSYDSITGFLTQLQDSAAGAFSATYDADGRILTQSLPNGLKADTVFDEAGKPKSLIYTKTTSCMSNCNWLSFNVKHSAHDQLTRETSSAFVEQRYAYDKAARLTEARDSRTGSCQTRAYIYDGDSNRTRSEVHPASAGNCSATTTPTSVASHTYDEADRLTDSGTQYDALGRSTTVPAGNAGGSQLTSTYYTDDRVRSLSQAGVTKTYDLDPMRRVRKVSVSGSSDETSHYADDSDKPSWTVSSASGNPWTRHIEGIDADVSAIQTPTGTTFQLANLHGDIVATASSSTSATGLQTTFSADEFGVPNQSNSPRYSWLGAKQRSTELASGVVAMGCRIYLPEVGRFTQVDPVPGGSANAYDYANQDPINTFDLDGRGAAKRRRMKYRAEHEKHDAKYASVGDMRRQYCGKGVAAAPSAARGFTLEYVWSRDRLRTPPRGQAGPPRFLRVYWMYRCFRHWSPSGGTFVDCKKVQAERKWCS